MATASGWHYRSGLVTALTHLMSTWSSADFISSIARDGGVDLDQSSIIVITNLGMHGPRRPSALAETLVTGTSNVSKIVARLETRGLVTRGTDPEDSRASLVQLTDEGNVVAAALSQAGDTLADDLLNGWSAAERTELERLLSAFDAASTAYARRVRPQTGKASESPVTKTATENPLTQKEES